MPSLKNELKPIREAFVLAVEIVTSNGMRMSTIISALSRSGIEKDLLTFRIPTIKKLISGTSTYYLSTNSPRRGNILNPSPLFCVFPLFISHFFIQGKVFIFQKANFSCQKIKPIALVLRFSKSFYPSDFLSSIQINHQFSV